MKVCGQHQFINGCEKEKYYLLYDESYLGQGYFIVHKVDNKITKFMKIYIMNDNGFPNYGLRAFSIDGKDDPNCEFNSIEFVFRGIVNFDNGLFDILSKLGNEIEGKIETIDSIQQGRNNFSLSLNEDVIRFIVSKDVYCGKQHPTDFIDINLGDNYTCQNYEAINSFYNSLVELCSQIAREKDIKKLTMLKIK